MWTYCRQFFMWLHVSSGQDQQLQSPSKTPGFKETVLPPNTATLWSVFLQTSCRPTSGKESSSETTSAQKLNCPSCNSRERTYLEAWKWCVKLWNAFSFFFSILFQFYFFRDNFSTGVIRMTVLQLLLCNQSNSDTLLKHYFTIVEIYAYYLYIYISIYIAV